MEELSIGKIGSTHGVNGFLRINSFSGEYEHFFKLKKITLEKDKKRIELGVEEVKKSGKNFLIKFDNIDNPEDAKKYINGIIWVSRSQASKLHKGEFYQSDLIGCNLIYNNDVLGSVIGIIEAGPSDLLEVKLKNSQTRLIPFQHHFTGKIDLKEKTIELKENWVLE
jgi:16S rRNA processing protein RimM